ncbi:UDP-galactose translocator 1 [Strigomonas culicis]|nr:UDP-galactose translocator 1 [Strigomonas culicis]|eukprot:EPY29350.1 UDP-galactose translocator 1 [Strigomonas culicis]
MQSRILFTGLLFTAVLRQPLTLRKWAALVLLTGGLALKYLSPHLQVDGYIALMLGQALLSALAGVYNEYYLKEDMNLSIHVQNFFMYFYGMIFNVVLGLLLNPSSFLSLRFDNLMNGQVALIVFFGASTGIAAAFILKFINVLVKAIASAVEVSLTALFARIILGEPFSSRDIPSALVVTAAIAVYYTKGIGEGQSWPKQQRA